MLQPLVFASIKVPLVCFVTNLPQHLRAFVPCQVQTMASLVDSEASFKHRVLELLGSTEYEALKRQGLVTYADLAFAVCEQPDKVSENLFDATCQKVFGTAVRRLVFEGMTFVINDLKHRAESGDLPPRSLPLQEREERRLRQVGQLRGLLIEGELEPSHSLVDKAAQMLQDGTVSYIPPSNCISRYQSRR